MSENNLSKAYRSSNKRLRVNELDTTYIVALFLMPLGLTMDFIVYPEKFTELISIRIVSVIFLLAGYQFHKYLQKDTGYNKHLTYFEFFLPANLSIAICLMIHYTGGIDSTYYAALNLISIGATLLLPFTLLQAALCSAMIISFYCLTLFINFQASDDYSIYFNNIYFILLTSIIGIVACHFSEKRRFSEFSLKYQLNIKNKQLATINKSKTEFFANISHELRTPLTLIISPLEDLERGSSLSDVEREDLIAIIKNNSYRLLKLVNDLLTSIKIDATYIVERYDIHILSVITETVDAMRVIANKQKLSVRIVNMKIINKMFINGNKDALDKIFINVINNAIKFTPPGGKITIYFEYVNGLLTTHISDTGIGISQNDLPHVFEPFRQGDSSTTRNYQGTGLGLSLVKKLVEELDGSISIDSVLNQGTTVSISFPGEDCSDDSVDIPIPHKLTPLEKIHKKADFTMQLNSPLETLSPYHYTPFAEPNIQFRHPPLNTRQQPTLLIVEDEPDLRAYLASILSDQYRIITASDGEQGLMRYHQHKPDLALIDLMLPKIDGIDLCRQIKAFDNHQCKIIMLTARADEDSKIQALTNGASDFLNKPFSTIELKTRLSNISDVLAFQKGLELTNDELKTTISNLKTTKSQLIQSEKINSIGSLAAGLLHEVNNPLNYAYTAVQILQREPSVLNNADSSEMVDDICEGMERIKQIVSDLHNFAHPGSVDDHNNFLLYNTVETAIRFTSADTKQLAIKMTNSIDRDIKVKASNSHILQVFINLINNATIALANTKEREILIASHCHNGRVAVTFRDNGCGIAKEKISRIFEPFYTTRDVGKGIGMGLSICHTIIQSHHGSLTVNSEEGVFTEFTFDLTLADEATMSNKP